MTEQRVIETHECLPHVFQDWMAQKGLLSRAGLPSFNFRYKVKRERPWVIDKLADILVNSSGYIVPNVTVAKALYEGQSGRSELLALGERVRNLSERLEEPELLYTAHRIGYGVAIDDFKLTHSNVRLMFLLWCSMGDFRSRDYLSSRLWSPAKAKMTYLNRDVYILRKSVLPKTGVAIETSDKMDSYRLVEI